jgi:AcrR family transcriptional regulator
MNNEVFLEIALRLYAQKGYESTSLREVAREAGVVPSVLSYRFGSKKGLLQAVISNKIANKTSELGTVLEKPETLSDFKSKLQIMFEVLVRERFSNRDEYKVLSDILRDISNLDDDHILVKDLSVVYEQIIDFLEFSKSQSFIKDSLEVNHLATMIFSIVRDSVSNHELNLRFLAVNNTEQESRRDLFKSFVELISNDKKTL